MERSEDGVRRPERGGKEKEGRREERKERNVEKEGWREETEK